MPIGIVKIEAKAEIGKDRLLPHGGKEIFIPAAKHVILGRTGIEFEMQEVSNSGVFKFCALPKNELIVRKEIQVGDSSTYDLHPYWFTLSVRDIVAFYKSSQGIGKKRKMAASTVAAATHR